jgi:hypothetical protein
MVALITQDVARTPYESADLYERKTSFWDPETIAI